MVTLQHGFDKRIYPAYTLNSLVEVLAEDGIASADALEGSDIRLEDLSAASTRISYRQLAMVFRNAIRLARSPLLAMRAGRRTRLTSCGIFGYALMCSASPQQAFDFTIKYQRLLGPAVGGGYRREGDTIVWTLEPLITRDPSDELYRFALEFHMAIALNLLRDAIHPDFKPLEIRLAYERPPHAHAYTSLFDCPLLFGQPRDELRLSAHWFDRRMMAASPTTSSQVREICERELAKIAGNAGISGRIYSMLVENPRQFPDIDTVASALNMSSRTLRRRLDAEGTSYRHILSEVRKQLALKYLSETPMTNEEIADRLGYSDAANFRKAFRQWTHGQPSEFRENAFR
ncbi:MAG: AraC family transcriptional regulator [Burkholderiaceae bacterium]